jgi:hypothetical protein
MNGGTFTDGCATLFNRAGDGTFSVYLLKNITLNVAERISGGDALPSRTATLYFFDARSACVGADGLPRFYVLPGEWEASSDRSGLFTFGASGGDWFVMGDFTHLVEPPYTAACRVVGVERFDCGRRHMRHFKLTGV